MKNFRAKVLRGTALLLAGVSALAAVYAWFCAHALTRDMRLVFDPGLDPLWWVSGAMLSLAAGVSAFALWKMLPWSSVAFGVFGLCFLLVLLVVAPWQDLESGRRSVWVWALGMAAIVVGLGASFRLIHRHARVQKEVF